MKRLSAGHKGRQESQPVNVRQRAVETSSNPEATNPEKSIMQQAKQHAQQLETSGKPVSEVVSTARHRKRRVEARGSWLWRSPRASLPRSSFGASRQHHCVARTTARSRRRHRGASFGGTSLGRGLAQILCTSSGHGSGYGSLL